VYGYLSVDLFKGSRKIALKEFDSSELVPGIRYVRVKLDRTLKVSFRSREIVCSRVADIEIIIADFKRKKGIAIKEQRPTRPVRFTLNDFPGACAEDN